MKKRLSSIVLVLAIVLVFVLTACSNGNNGNSSQLSQEIEADMIAENERLRAEIEAVRLQIEIETLRSELAVLQEGQAEIQQCDTPLQDPQEEDTYTQVGNDVEETEPATAEINSNNAVHVTVNDAHVSSALNMTSSEIREFFGPPYTIRHSYWNGRGDGHFLDFTSWGVYFADDNLQASWVYVDLSNVDCWVEIDSIRISPSTREELVSIFRNFRGYQITEGINDYLGEEYLTVFIGDHEVTFSRQLGGDIWFDRAMIMERQ